MDIKIELTIPEHVDAIEIRKQKEYGRVDVVIRNSEHQKAVSVVVFKGVLYDAPYFQRIFNDMCIGLKCIIDNEREF